MAILAKLLAYCFNENEIFAVLKRQTYNRSIHSHIIHADAGWLGLSALRFMGAVFSLHSSWFSLLNTDAFRWLALHESKYCSDTCKEWNSYDI